jgi:tryptophan synthase alpha chain
MTELDRVANGFIYCVARRGVTGKKSDFGEDFTDYLARCRAATRLPIAVGFGIQSREDIEVLTGQADMAVIGSQTIRLVDEHGPEAVGPFIAGLRRDQHILEKHR